MSNKKMPSINGQEWLHVFRSITGSTNERTMIADSMPKGGAGNSAPLVQCECAQAVASALIIANMNSLPLDWAACISVGGTNMSFYIVKQLPVLPPEAFLEKGNCGQPWVQLIVPRVLELTYTSIEMTGFASDLGFHGPPFPYNEERRHCLKCELDGIFAHMYGLDRSELEWILDAPAPISSFPGLKSNEIKEFGEYRTKRYVLSAFDLLDRGEAPELTGKI